MASVSVINACQPIMGRSISHTQVPCYKLACMALLTWQCQEMLAEDDVQAAYEPPYPARAIAGTCRKLRGQPASPQALQGLTAGRHTEQNDAQAAAE